MTQNFKPKIGGALLAASAIAWWFMRGTFEAWFFDEVLRTISPDPRWSWVVEYGPPALLAGIAVWLLWGGMSHRTDMPAPEKTASLAQEDAERQFEKGFHRAALQKSGSQKDAKLLLATLRGEGVSIRNHPQSVDHMFPHELDDWIAHITRWMDEVIEAIRVLDAADAEWFKTLGEVPPPRIGIPNIRLGGKDERESYAKAFREHDFRLARLDKLFTKYGIGA